MATASVFVGVSEKVGKCPLHPPGAGWVCVEAGHFLATARKWRVCHERVECVRRAIEGRVGERWVLEHPSPTPDIPTLMDLPPVVGWVCVPKDVFEADTAKLTAATLELARLQLELEKEEEEERRRSVIPAPPPFQVSDIGRVIVQIVVIKRKFSSPNRIYYHLQCFQDFHPAPHLDDVIEFQLELLEERRSLTRD